jgi:Ca2+:H+ antiporter
VATPKHQIHWTSLTPPIALAGLALFLLWSPNGIGLAVAGVLMVGSVLAAVHHAEVVAHKIGEPFGSLVLAVAVTIIEVALIVTLMAGGKGDTTALPRDTVFAAVMITCNGIIGMSLLMGSRRHHTIVFNAEGAGAALACVITLATLCLVFPAFTTTISDPVYTGAQLAFAGIASLTLYMIFVITQTIRHRDFFLPITTDGSVIVEDADDPDNPHAQKPSNSAALTSLGLLLVALVATVGLAKIESHPIESGVAALGLPHAVVGVIIALLVLLPEGIAAVRAALRDRTQTSLNLALGSAMASIGLTIPTIAIASIWLDDSLTLGLGPVHIVLLSLTALVTALTVVPGRATRLQGGVHLTILAAFIFFSIQP